MRHSPSGTGDLVEETPARSESGGNCFDEARNGLHWSYRGQKTFGVIHNSQNWCARLICSLEARYTAMATTRSRGWPFNEPYASSNTNRRTNYLLHFRS